MLGFKRPSREQKRRSRLILRTKEYEKQRLTNGHYCSLDRADGSSQVVTAVERLASPVVIAWHPSTYRFLVSPLLVDNKPQAEVFHLSAAHTRHGGGFVDYLLRPGDGFRVGSYVFCIEREVEPETTTSTEVDASIPARLRLLYWTETAENNVHVRPLTGHLSLGKDSTCNVVLPAELFPDVSIGLAIDSAGSGVRLTTKYDVSSASPQQRLMLRVGSPTPLATGDSLYFSGIHHRIVVYGGSDHVVTKSLSLPNLPSEVTNSHAMVRARNARRSAMAAATSTDSDGTSTPTLSHSHRLSSSSFIGGRTPPLAEIREVRRSNHDCTKDDAATRSSAEQALASGVANLTVTTTPRTPIHRSSRSAPTTDTSFLTPAASSSGVGSADTTHGGRHHHPPSATPSPSLSSSRLSSPSTIYTPQVSAISPLLVSQHPSSSGDADGGVSSLDSHHRVGGSGGRSISRTGHLARGSPPPTESFEGDASTQKGHADASGVVLPSPPALRLRNSNDSGSDPDAANTVLVLGREVPPSVNVHHSSMNPGHHIEEVIGHMEASPHPRPHSQRLVMDSDEDDDDHTSYTEVYPPTPTHAEPNMLCFGTGQRPNLNVRKNMEDRLVVAEDLTLYRGANGPPLANLLTGGAANDSSTLVRTDVHEHAQSPNPPPNLEGKWRTSPASLFAALDGHGNYHVADFVAASFADHVARAVRKTGICDPSDSKEVPEVNDREIVLDGNSAYTNTMRDAFAAVSRHLEGLSKSNEGGTTIASCLIVDDEQTGVRRLITANLGDAQAVLCRNGEPVSLIVDHNCTNESEIARVQSEGGTITGGRLLCLNVTRSFGDRFILDCGKGFSNIPSITETVLGPEDEFIIISTDGLFRKVSDLEAVSHCRSIADPTQMVKLILDLAISRGSKDNLACVAVRLAPPVPDRIQAASEISSMDSNGMMISVSPPRSSRGSRQGSFSVTSISSARSNETIVASDHEMSVGSITPTNI